MKNRFLNRLAVLMVVLASLAGMLAFSNSPARADTATGWVSNHWLKAYSGGGCAYWNNATPGSELFSGTCGQFFENISYRVITRTSGQQVLQIAEVAAGVDLTVVSGAWRWETANSSTHVFPIDLGNDGIYLMFQGSNPIHFMGPNGKNLPLKDIVGTSDEVHAGWQIFNCASAC